MSNSNGTSDDLQRTNGDWHGTDAEYPAGMLWEGSMFPSASRDENIWGPQDPLDVVGPAGPFDEEDGDNSWRVYSKGKHVYTNEARIMNKRPSKQQQGYQTKFWKKYDVQKAQTTEAGAQEQMHEDADGEQFPDALPTHSGPVGVPAPTGSNIGQQSATPAPVVIRAAPSGKRLGSRTFEYLRTREGLQDQPASAALSSYDINGEFEEDDEYLRDALQTHAAPVDDHDNLPDSTPPKTSSHRGVDDWNDDNLLSFWKFKVIKKKGYEPMLAHFPGQTTDSLHKTWKTHRQRCEELGAAWRAAGKPTGSVSQWLNE